MILGAVLAGGRSTRFGTDKAMAELGGHTLLARAVVALGRFCDRVVIAGRTHGPAPCIPDWPGPGMGPLGGMAAALRHAEEEGYASVLTCGVDSVALPQTLLADLSPPPAFLETQPVIGHWNSNAASKLAAILQSEGRHSVMAFATAAGARPVKSEHAPANINTPADLAAMEQTHGI